MDIFEALFSGLPGTALYIWTLLLKDHIVVNIILIYALKTGHISILQRENIMNNDSLKIITYAIGLDIGIASVGSAIVALDESDKPCGIIRMEGSAHISTGRSIF